MATALPVPELMLLLAIILELVGATLLLIGYRTRVGATLLIGFTIVATAFFHNNLADQMQMILFMKNIAITGGLLSVLVYGGGAISMDNKKSK